MHRAPAAALLAAGLMLAITASPMAAVSAGDAAPAVTAPGDAPASPGFVLQGGAPADAATPPSVPKAPVPGRRPAAQRPDLTFASRPAPKGFRGLAWNASVSEATTQLGLEPVTKPTPLASTFQRPGEALKLGQADIRTVAYYFPKGRFRGVGITFDGEANFFLIKDHLIELYGPGRQVGDRYGWTWNDCNIDLRLKDGAGELRYTYEK